MFSVFLLRSLAIKGAVSEASIKLSSVDVFPSLSSVLTVEGNNGSFSMSRYDMPFSDSEFQYSAAVDAMGTNKSMSEGYAFDKV